MPQLLLQAVHSDQWPTRQSRRRFDAANEARRRDEPVPVPVPVPLPETEAEAEAVALAVAVAEPVAFAG